MIKRIKKLLFNYFYFFLINKRKYNKKNEL